MMTMCIQYTMLVYTKRWEIRTKKDPKMDSMLENRFEGKDGKTKYVVHKNGTVTIY